VRFGCLESSAKMGEIIRDGPLHAAQKWTRTGSPLLVISWNLSKLDIFNISIEIYDVVPRGYVGDMW